MIITHKLQPMDLTHKQNTARVDVVQDDKYSRNVEFTLTSNGVAWQIPDGTAAVVRYKKPDGTGGNYDALPDGSTAYQISGNVLTVSLAPQVCTVPGRVQLSVGLIQGSAEINTFTVDIVVQPNPGSTYQSEDYIQLSGAVPNSGWTPNMYLGTDASGNVVAKEWAGGGVGTVSVDSTLTQSGQAADAAVVGDRLSALSEEIAAIPSGKDGADGKSAYQYAVEGGYTGTETEFTEKMAQEKFANPNALTFTGAVSATYDGSAPVSLEIPSGGSGGGGVSAFEKIGTVDLSTMAASNLAVEFTVTDVTEIVLIWTGMANTTQSNSSLLLVFNSGDFYNTLGPRTGKSGAPQNGYTYLKVLENVGILPIVSAGAISNINYTQGGSPCSYNLIPVKEKIQTFEIRQPSTQYYADAGIVEVYVR